ncbi:MAG: hypothetical protein KF699_14330 [Phycisphaeraceae bacterium]|nr:hypothetical protein [Phycisphaeraceae bacterium]
MSVNAVANQDLGRTMPDNVTPQSPSASRVAVTHGSRFRLAVVKARKGRFEEAGADLQQARNEGQCSDADALDLQARMYAQQGLHLQAETCWRKALQLGGARPEYIAALGRLYVPRASRGRLVAIGCYAILGAIAILVSWQVLLVLPARHRQLVQELDRVSAGHTALESAVNARIDRVSDVVSAVERSGRQREEQATNRLVAALGDLAAQSQELRTSQEAATRERQAILAKVSADVAVSQRQMTDFESRVTTLLADVQRAANERQASEDLARSSLHEWLQGQIGRLASQLDAQEDSLCTALDSQSQVTCALFALQAQIDRTSSESAAAMDSVRRELGELRLMLKRPQAEVPKGAEADRNASSRR